MRHANNEKQETTHDGRDGTTKPRKNQNARSKGNLQILGNIGNTIEQVVMKEKIKKEYLWGTKNYSKPNYTTGTS